MPRARNTGSRVVLVCGSRRFIDYEYIFARIADLQDKGYGTVVHGSCAGADQIAGRAALHLGMECRPEPAKWAKFHSAAGPIRNRAMLHIHEPDLVVAFPLQESEGTWDMVNAAKYAGVPVQVHHYA